LEKSIQIESEPTGIKAHQPHNKKKDPIGANQLG
jgi:hypothetical protein